MKYLALCFLILTSSLWARPCEVDGISDSPRGLNCYIHYRKSIEKLNLLCLDGIYHLEWKEKRSDVRMAFHMDVESGSSPLVFETDEMTLTNISNKLFGHAELAIEDEKYQGLCFDK